MDQCDFQKGTEKNTTAMAKHPATGRALCRHQQRDDVQCPNNFTGPAPLHHPNGTVPFVLKSLSASTVTLLGAALGCRVPISRDQVCYRPETSIGFGGKQDPRRTPTTTTTKR